MTLIKPLRPCMWPLMPSTARAAGCSGRRFSADSQRFAARFGAHAWCCAADQRPGTIPRLGPGPGTTLVWPPQPVMWPQLPCTARAVGRSGRSFAVSSQRFAARFAARARCSHGRHRYTDNKRSSRPHRPQGRLYDLRKPRVKRPSCRRSAWLRVHAPSARKLKWHYYGSKLALELKIEIWKDLRPQIHTRHVLRFPL